MIKRIFLLLAVLAVFTAGASAEELNYNGSASVRLNQQAFHSGEELNAQIELFNNEKFPIADSYIVMEIVKGGEFQYPSQLFDGDNVVFEQKIAAINLAQKGSKKIEFKYKFQESMPNGSYRLDVYFKNTRAPIAGIPSIFLNPKPVSFSYFGQSEMPEAKILRTKTTFNGITGPVGSAVEPGSIVNGNIFIENPSSTDLQELKLVVSICDWDDTAEEYNYCPKNTECERILKSNCTVAATQTIDSLKKSEQKEIEVQLQAPPKASAYAVKLELKNSKNELMSLYRNRIIVTGATRHIHKLYTNNFYFKPNDTVEISALVGPSPDHFNNPILKNSILILSAKNRENNETIFTQTIELDEKDFLEKKASFAAPSELKEIQICGKIEKDSTMLDEYCYDIDAIEFAATQKKEIKADWEYNKKTQMLTVNFCSVSPGTLVQAINIIYQLRAGTQTVKTEEIKSNGCVEKSFNLPIGKYGLTMDNLDTNMQTRSTIDLEEYLKACVTLNCNDNNPCTMDDCKESACYNIPLANGTTCGSNKVCVAGKCTEENKTLAYIAIAIALIIIIAAAYLCYFKGRKK